MPRVEDLIDRVGNATFITTLDLTKGYWQVPVAEEDKPKTAPYGLYQFTRMPFGLQGVPATFQRMVDKLLEGLEEFASAYMDDIIIFSTAWNAHLHQLSSVLDCIQQMGLTVKIKKCQFAMAECGYLGYRVGSGKVRPQDLKVKAIQQIADTCSNHQDTGSLAVRHGRVLPQIYTPVRFHYSSTYRPHP